MPTKRRRRMRGYVQPVSPAVLFWFRTGSTPKNRRAPEADGVLDLYVKSEEQLRAEWDQVREQLLTEWTRERPGTRPEAWWRFDAPRWARDAHFAEPRRRVGGIGTPCHEAFHSQPSFHAGLPVYWVTTFEEQYFNGRRRDVNGNPIGTEYRDGHFAGRAPRADDPPTFESEATYLQRHRLLTAAELRQLGPKAFAPEVLAVIDDADTGTTERIH